MANTYTWVVNSMVSYPESEGYTNVVTTVNWTCNGTDGTYLSGYSAATGVKLDPNAPYVPYADLTEDQVIGWVKNTIGENQVIAVQNAVAAQIANDYYKPTVLPNPWG